MRQKLCSTVMARDGIQVLEVLAEGGTRVIAMRCAGFDRVDVGAAESLGIKVLTMSSPRAAAASQAACTTGGCMLLLQRTVQPTLRQAESCGLHAV